MSREAVEGLIDKWINDAEFREEVKKDPEAAVRKTGAALDETEWAALKNMDWNVSDEELRTRASKMGGF